MPENLKELQWGTFTPAHIISLILAVGIIAGLYFILRGRTEKTKWIVLSALSFFPILAVIYDIVMWGIPGTVLQYLPLHLCTINATLLPFLTLRKSNFLGNLLPVYSVGAIVALVFNTFQAEYLIFSHVFPMYYFTHVIDFGVPLLMLALGLVKIRPKYILPCLGTTFGLYTVIHFINILINNYLTANPVYDYLGELIQVDYMYSLDPMGNPALEFFWSLIPYPYFYMLTTLPIFALVYLLLNINHIIRAIKARRAQNE